MTNFSLPALLLSCIAFLFTGYIGAGEFNISSYKNNEIMFSGNGEVFRFPLSFLKDANWNVDCFSTTGESNETKVLCCFSRKKIILAFEPNLNKHEVDLDLALNLNLTLNLDSDLPLTLVCNNIKQHKSFIDGQKFIHIKNKIKRDHELLRGIDLLELMCKLKQYFNNNTQGEAGKAKSLFLSSVIENICLHTGNEELTDDDVNEKHGSDDDDGVMVTMLVILDNSVLNLNYQDAPIPKKFICLLPVCNYTSDVWMNIATHMQDEHPLMAINKKKSIHDATMLWPRMHDRDKNHAARSNFPTEIELAKEIQKLCCATEYKYKIHIATIEYIIINK